MTARTLFLCAVSALLAGTAGAQSAQAPAQCNASAGATAFFDLEGSPFSAVATPDGCTIFVSLVADVPGTGNGIAVFKREGGKVSFERMLGDTDTPYGMVLTHDGKILIVANNSNVVLLDVARMLSGEGTPLLGYIAEPGGDSPLNLYANVSPDDRFLFIAEEAADRIAVVDLESARRTNFADLKIKGRIPAGLAPIALTFSPDAKLLYVTTQQTPDSEHPPAACKPEGQDPAAATIEDPEGTVLVIDVARAETDPENSVVAEISAGCSPVRLALSPDGARAYVTARNDNALLVFDTAKLTADPDHARIATIPVGTAPVGVAVVDQGKKIVVANSDRFNLSTAGREGLVVIDSAKVQAGTAAILGRVRSGLFPRELSLSADGKTLLATNSDSDQLELVDLSQLP